jgi:hypothetical protein
VRNQTKDPDRGCSEWASLTGNLWCMTEENCPKKKTLKTPPKTPRSD